MNNEPDAPDNEEGTGGGVSTICDALGDLITGIPGPIRKNAFRAFTRLCTAAVEYPVALIEGAIVERRAESQARVKLINASASQIAEQMQTNPEYVRAAAAKFGRKIIRERVNVDKISAIAAEELKPDPLAKENNKEPEASPISEDWLNAFESEAAQMSSEQMQRLFGKILAGEIRNPTSYSIKTLKIMAQLDNQAAVLFRRLCSLSISLRIPGRNIIDARVVSMGRASSNSLQPYGLGFGQLNIMQEYGLIITDYDSYMDYRPSVVHENNVVLPLIYQNAQWALVPKSPRQVTEELKLNGVAFSQVGKEILSIVETDTVEKYTVELKKLFDQKGIIMTAIGDGVLRTGEFRSTT